MHPLEKLVNSFIVKGTLRVHDAAGGLREFGSGQDGPVVTMRIHDKSTYRKIFLSPELAVAEAYMDGQLTLEDGSEIYDLLNLFSVNRKALGVSKAQRYLRRMWRFLKFRHQSNDVESAKRNARAHYDLSTDLYRLFLDSGLNYSCAYFRSPDDDLETAQRAKLDHVISKLGLEPGMRVLEIGGGWGSLAIRLAEAGAHVVTLNVSNEQMTIAAQRAAEAGVADRIDFVLKDYREYEGSFDRIVSVGMMEHVGAKYYDTYFGKVRDLLAPGGYAFIHSIGRTSPPGTTGPFIRKYIFPGGYIPAVSEVFAAIERTGLWVADMEVLRLHYHYTIKHWRQRFATNRERAAELYDERFCRMWEFYLSAAELDFQHGNSMVFQLLLSNTRDAVPITRDFMVDAERAGIALKGQGQGQQPK
jgi:cyclopropane-fatty-acyl-phospholipid synthase